jgi:thiosulfate/3-mercaptopyruvate sulfurtransferase
MLSPFIPRSRLLVLPLALLLGSACHTKTESEATPAQPEVTSTARAESPPTEMPSLHPADLAQRLAKSGPKPLLFHVGFKKLYDQAHIPGSEYLGPTSEAEAVDKLKQRVASLPRNSEIVVYCGCCPWTHCPNVKPAYRALHELGFTNAKVLYIAKDFGADWVDHGYPVEKGP